MKRLGRDLEKIEGMIGVSHRQSDQCYVPPILGKAPHCRICGSERATLFASIWGKYEYYECDRCGAAFLYNLPDVKRMYSESETMNDPHLIDDKAYQMRVEMITGPKVQFVLNMCAQV